MITLLCLSFALFAAYVLAVIVTNRGVPESISDSFYIFNGKVEGLGYIFTIWCFVTGISVAAVMFELSIGAWYQFLGLFAGGGLCFAGAAPLFKSGTERIHYASAATCALAAALYISLSGYYIFLLPVAVTAFVARKNRIFYSELAIFIVTYISLLISI
jgi:hypothetical protein